jgi:apolipoprotein N-acyltransferase
MSKEFYDLTIERKLWGGKLLPFYLMCWILWVWIFHRKDFLHNTKRKNWIFSVVSGIVLAVSFPPMTLAPLVFFGFVPLWLVWNELEGTSRRREIYKFSFHSFLLWNILTTWWVGNAAMIGGFFANWTNALIMCFPVFFYLSAKQQILKVKWFGPQGKWSGNLLLFIPMWMAYEYIHQNWEVTWPWLTLGNYWSSLPKWVQWYSFTGTSGGTLWILVGNYLIFQLVKNKNYQYLFQAKKLVYLSLFLSWIFIPIFISFIILKESGDNVQNTLSTVIVQPNYEPHYEKFEIADAVQWKNFVQLSESVMDTTTDLVLWPETSFEQFNFGDFSSNTILHETDTWLSRYPNTYLVSGMGGYSIFSCDRAPERKSIRRSLQGGVETCYEGYNAAISYKYKLQIPKVYFKSKLVPGVEILPFYEIIGPILRPMVDYLGGTMEGLGTQSTRDVFEVKGGVKVAPIICYESVYSDYVADYVRAGAQVLTIMTNDGWWDNTIGHRQHLLIGRLRAIETKRYIARSANTGISCLINPKGEILDAISYGEKGSKKLQIPILNEQTWFVKNGDILSPIAGIASSVILLISGILALFWRFRRRI